MAGHRVCYDVAASDLVQHMPTIRRAEASEIRRVMRQTLGAPGLSWAQLEQQVDAFGQYARQMNLDLTNHWVAHNGTEWLSAATYIESPGRTAMAFLSSGFDDPTRREATVKLLEELKWFAELRSVRLLQCLLDPSGRPPQALGMAGFSPLARLDYLDRATASPVGPVNLQKSSSVLNWSTYSLSAHREFAETVSATYEESRDCPGLTGVREIDEVIEGHRAAARFDPAWWLLLRGSDKPLGCLLMGEVPLRNAAEIIYMGLCPEARGRGLGRFLLTRALELARGGRLRSLALAVDSSNEPALRVYTKFGFRHTLSREAWICVLNPATKR